jgi:alpha-ketoglutarate-dependent taurine dioxygenase
MKTEKLEPTLGAVIRELNLCALTSAEWDKIYQQFLEHAVLIFPEQHLSKKEQEGFAIRFGEIEHLTEGAKTTAITNKTPKGVFYDVDSEWTKLLKGNEGWHTDSSYMSLTAKSSILSAHVVPEKGGETQWADMRSAYDELDDRTKKQVENLSASHSYFHSQAKIGHHVKVGANYGFVDGEAPVHPIVKIHPETGRPALFIGRHACKIPELSEQASESLLDHLMSLSCQSPRILTHTWNKGDLVVWDNRCVLHRARPYPPNQERLMLHTRIKGDRVSESALNI